MKRAVIDTGVVVSALLKKEGTSRQAFIQAFTKCQPLISFATLAELEEVINRPKFNALMAREDVVAVLELTATRGELIDILSSIAECRDPKDNKFLNLAVDGRADVIISRDPDLLVIHPFRHIPILNPADFIRWMGESDASS
ncbi:MAG: putative toxin-antitoxin system toxin component, PIN family [Cyclobacteriaceae bacterium]